MNNLPQAEVDSPGREAASRALVLAHWSMAEPSITACRAVLGAHRIDLLAYGSGSGGAATYASDECIELPSLRRGRAEGLRALLLFMRRVRRHHYSTVVIAQPGLRMSRARGLLLAFAYFPRSDTVLAMGGPAGPFIRVGPGQAVGDFMFWLLTQVWCSLIAAVATPVLSMVARHTRTSRRVERAGRVVYLRTDLELVGKRLEVGGSLAHTLGIIHALRRHGYQVELWCTGGIDGLASDVSTRHLPALVRANWPTEVAELVSGLRQSLAGLRRRPADAFIYQRYSLNNLTGLILARRWKLPLILEANASEVQWRKDWSSLRYQRLSAACERLLLRAADRVIVVSGNAERDLLRAGADRGRLRVVPNGVDVDRLANAVPRELGFPPEVFVIAFCGLFYRWHGVATLAEAFIQLRRRRPQLRLLLVGEGEEEARVKAILRDAGALEDCVLPGLVTREEVPNYLAAADVLVSPHADVRNFIGSPIKIFEYMASGKPIVASRLAQLAEVLTDEETALLVPPGDSVALASALERLMEDSGLRHRLGAGAQHSARVAHSWDARLEAILSEEHIDLRNAGPQKALAYE